MTVNRMVSIMAGFMVLLSWRAQNPSATFFEDNVAWEKFTNS